MILTWIKNLFIVPDFGDVNKNRAAKLLNIVLLLTLAATLLGTLILLPTEADEWFVNLLTGVVISVFVWGLRQAMLHGYLKAVGVFLAFLLWASITFLLFMGGGINDASLTGYFLVIAVASLFLSGSGVIIFAGLCLGSTFVILFLDIFNVLEFAYRPAGFIDLVTITLTLGLTALLLRFSVHGMDVALLKAQSNEQAQLDANRELQGIRASLEERVLTRTQALEVQSKQLRLAAEVVRLAVSVHDLEKLLVQVPRLVATRFGLSHVGIFLLDSVGEYALLRGASSSSGQRMLSVGYRVRIGDPEIISAVIQDKSPHVAQEVVRVVDPILSRTRSEVALPLIVGDQLLGVLDLHSTLEDVFHEDDLVGLVVLADQVAVSIENASLFAETQSALQAARRAYAEISRDEWIEMLKARTDLSFRSDEFGIARVPHIQNRENLQALQAGQPILRPEKTSAARHSVAVPIKVRDNVVGVIETYKDSASGEWSQDELVLLQQLTDQVALALESARLYEETQRRAAREELTGEITSRIRETLDLDTVLQTAVEQIRQSLGLQDAMIQLGAGAVQPSSESPDTIG